MEILVISTIGIILTRMMNEALFADAVFDDADKALMEYNLLPELIERLKSVSRSRFVSMTLEDRKAFAAWVIRPNGLENPLSLKDQLHRDLAVDGQTVRSLLNKTNLKRRNKEMSQTDFQKLIDRVMTDEAFAKELANNPEATLKSIGIEATPEMLDAMKGVDAASLKQLASAFGDERAAL